MVRRSVVILAAFWCLFSAPSAAAQSIRDREGRLNERERIESEIERAQVRVGPFRLLSSFRIGDPTYSNDFYLPDAQEDDDWVISLTAPQKLFFVPRKKFAASVEVEPTYLYFVKHEEYRDWGARYRGDLHFLFNRLYVDLYGEMEDRHTRELSELTDLVEQESAAVGALSELLISSRSQARASARHREYDYPAQIVEGLQDIRLLNRQETGLSASFTHKTFATTALTVGTDVNFYDFDSDIRDSRKDTVFVGAKRSHGLHEAEARIGFTQLVYDDPAQEDFDDVTGAFEWTVNPRRRVRFSAGVARDVQFSIFANDLHFREDRARIGGSYLIGERLTLDAGLQVGTNDYFKLVAAPDGTSKKRQDDLMLATAGFLVKVVDFLSVGLGWGWLERDSNFDQFDEDGIQLMLRLSITP